MKETIYTIPVNDGFNEKGECPFCNMYRKLETDAIEYTLGASYMEDDIRMKTNELGFCSKHYKSLHELQNALGLALVLHTHVQKINVDLAKLTKNIRSEKKGFFGKQTISNTTQISDFLLKLSNSCFVCDRANDVFLRYFDTFFHLFKQSDEIAQKVKNSSGFCLNHFAQLLEIGEKKLNANEYSKFVELIVPLQLENMKRLEGELDWFTQKFDYKNKDKPWGTSKDAVLRGLLKVGSVKCEE